jgi:metacaspase-1
MPSSRRALCVGINQYQNYPSATLQGCVNDVQGMKSVLTKYLGFTAADIIELTNSQATKANIMKNLNDMVAGAKAGTYTYLVFSMSSHGTQVPDKEGDEPDRADEAFCPNDLAEKGGEWDRAHVIVDDELHDLFVQLPSNVLLEVYLDTCHSGTGLKAVDLLLDRKPRYLPPPSLDAFEKVDGKRSHGLYRAMLESGITHHVLWAACRADQTSADAKIGEKWHGAFTYYWVQEMIATQNTLSRKDLLAKVIADLNKGRYSQVPQLEGEATNRDKSIS